MKKTLIIAALLSLTISIYSQSSKDPYSSQKVKAFADDLYANGFYEEAAGEYRRYLFQTENKDFSAFTNLTNIYRENKDSKGFDWLNTIIKPVFIDADLKQFDFYYAENIFLRKDKDLFKRHISTAAKDENTQIIFDTSLFILNNDIPTAKESFKNYEGFYSKEVKQAISEYSPKSPLLALSLSTIIPGSGKWYGGSFWSGFNSFITIGFEAYGTYWCYDKYGIDNWRTISLGAITVISYITELYGSYQNALRVNEAQYRKISEEMEKLYKGYYD